jgi:quercetin dioxygenase-like cupin family protein
MDRITALNLAVRSLVATILVLSTLAIASAQQQGGQNSFFNNFTGEISIVDSSEMRSSRIRFEAGSRTNWHLHSERQLILIEEGQGRLQEMGGPVIVLEAGEPYYTRAGVPHWHGAAPDEPAVQFSVYSGTLDWQQPVTDQEYLARE